MSTTETVIIGGKDYTATDAEARAIMAHLADQGVTEATVAHTSYRELVNMILLARRQLEARP
jgi:hypothetical protein